MPTGLCPRPACLSAAITQGLIALLLSGCSRSGDSGSRDVAIPMAGRSPSSTMAPAQPAPKYQFKSKADFEVTAEDVAQEFMADNVAAEKKYKDKIVRITGKVDSTEDDGIRTIIVNLKTGTPAILTCGVLPSFAKQVHALRREQEVTLQGIGLRWSPASPYLDGKDLIIINADELGH